MKLKINIIYNILYQLITLILPIITAPYISRALGKEGVGLYALSTSVASYFALFILLGVGNYGAKTIAKNSTDKLECSKTFLSIYIFQLFNAVVVVLVYLIYLKIYDEYKKALLIQLLYLISVALDFNWYFAGTEQFKITVRRGIIIKILQVISIFIFIKSPTDVYKYIFIMCFGVMLGQVMLIPLLFKQIYFVKIKIKDILQHIKPNLVLFIPILATSVFTIMDKIMIDILGNDIGQVGVYEYSEKIVKIPLGIITAIGVVMLPKISNLVSHNDKNQTKIYFDLTMKYLGILVVAMAFGVAAISDVLVFIFYGIDFLECSKIIVLLSIIMITVSWANIIRTQYLIPNDKNSIYVIAVISGAIINLMLNVLLIPRLHAYGAAIGTIGAELTLCIIHTVPLWKKLDLKRYFIIWTSYAVFGLIMYIIVYLVGQVLGASMITLIIQILIGILVYGLEILLYLYITKDKILLKYTK